MPMQSMETTNRPMTYRYFPACDEWLETSEIEISDDGERVCPEHKAVHGSIPPSDRYHTMSEAEFRREHMYLTDVSSELNAAIRQGLVEQDEQIMGTFNLESGEFKFR